MMVWKMIFLFNWVIFRFHVNLPGCSIQSFRSTTCHHMSDPDPRGIPIHRRPVLQGPAVREHSWMDATKVGQVDVDWIWTSDHSWHHHQNCITYLLLIIIAACKYFFHIILPLRLTLGQPNCDAEDGRWARTTERPLLPPGGLPVRQLGSRMSGETGVEQMIHLIWPNYTIIPQPNFFGHFEGHCLFIMKPPFGVTNRRFRSS